MSVWLQSEIGALSRVKYRNPKSEIRNPKSIIMVTQEIINLYDAFTHGQIRRRDFIARLTVLAGGMAAAMKLLPLLENDYAHADAKIDGISSEYITYPGASGEMRAYHAKPESEGPYPAVVVIHENRGLNPHIEQVARKTAAAGFWAIAPDALSPLGGTPEDSDLARTKIGELDAQVTLQDFIAAVNFASKHPSTTGKIGCVGFCWGGRMANLLAVNCENLGAAVAFYGGQPDAKDVPRIKAAVMLHYAGLDERVNAGIPAYEEALKAADVNYLIHMYEDVNHAFHNDTSPTRYNEEAAELAWSRTIAFFNTHLR
jgi:carboxymethylenebutenolidase